MNVQAYIISADYPRTNHPEPLAPGSEPTQPDLQFTVEVDVRGLSLSLPTSGYYLKPDLRELERLLVEPIAAAVTTALRT